METYWKALAPIVIFPERDAIKMAYLTMRGVADYIPLVNGSGIVKVKTPGSFIGRTLEDVGLSVSSKNGAVAIVIQRGKECILSPGPQEVISHVDVLVIAGNNPDIDRLLEKAEKGENTKQ
jgi:uncharacterized protein with PhoU and TrkA domain